MIYKQIQLGPVLDSSNDDNAGAYPVCTNVIIDKRGSVRRRPGICASSTTSANVPGEVDSLYITNDDRLFATSDGHIYRVGPAVAVDRTAAGNTIPGTLRPVVAETQSLLVYTAGGDPHKLVLATELPSPLGGAPPVASFVVANAGRLLVNNYITYRSRVSFSSVTISSEDYSGHESWVGSATSSAGVFTAEGKVDDVVALAMFGNAVHAIGHRNTQKYVPGDAERPYVFAGAVDIGTYAPYSLIDYEGSIALLDQSRRFVVYTGNNVSYISEDIQQSLDDLNEVSDCYGYRFREGFADVLIWKFPTEGRTFAYQLRGGWSQWCSHSGGQPVLYPVTAAVNRYSSAENMIAYDTGSGTSQMAQSSLGAVDDNGTPFIAHVVTGDLDYNTSETKVCAGLHIHMKRGIGASASDVALRVSWSDNRGTWTNPIEITAGIGSDTENVISLRGLGAYKSRSWKFEIFNQTSISKVIEEIYGGED